MAQSRSPSELARDRQNISELYLKHYRQDEIAAKLGINQSTVSRDLKVIQEEWRKSSLMNMNEAKQRELTRIDELERTYWDAWERSKGEVKTTTRRGIAKVPKVSKVPGNDAVEEKSGPVPMSQEVTEHIETQVGDPRYLAGVMNCIERRCAILGIDAPKRQDITSGGEAIKGYTVLASPADWDAPKPQGEPA